MFHDRRGGEAGRRAGVRATLGRRSLALALLTALLAPASGALAAGGPICTPDGGQELIDDGRYDQAVKVFSCVIAADPTEVEGYRGRIEAQLLLGRYSDAMRDFTRVTAVVEPVQPDALATIHDGYATRLAADPSDVAALTGAGFARWYDFDYVRAIKLLDRLLGVRADDPFGNLFRGSSRLLHGGPRDAGAADLERAIELAPVSPDVRWVVADAYTYGLPDPERAFTEASLALAGGLDTARVHALLGAAYTAFGDLVPAAEHVARHIELVTTELVVADALHPATSLRLALVPGRTDEIPVPVVAGEAIAITTSSRDYWDTIAVLRAPDGSPLLGSDDVNGYFAAFEWVAPATATYRLQVTFFESVNSGQLVVDRG